MAEETKKTPQTPEEIAREAQAQAMKAALEQAQALYGNVPGFEGTDLMKMHEKLMQDSAEMFPGVAEAQAYQVEKPRDFDPFGHAGFAHLWLQYD